jgi:hypothetical protein
VVVGKREETAMIGKVDFVVLVGVTAFGVSIATCAEGKEDVSDRRERGGYSPEREAIKQQYGTLFTSISDALFKADPIGINYDTNTDEYEPEARTIILRLSSAKSEEDVQSIVYEDFRRWFAPVNVGPREKYASVSAAIWKLWCAHSRLKS